MKTFVVVLCLAVAASASMIGHGIHHHIPSGSIAVGHDGVVIAGPAGSVHTDNGLHGHGAGARLSGPAGDVRTHRGHVELDGPGIGHHGVGHIGVGVGHIGVGMGLGGLGHGLIGGLGHGGVIAHGLVGHGHHGW